MPIDASAPTAGDKLSAALFARWRCAWPELGVSGALKTVPEDFLVIERASHHEQAAAEGPHLYLYLEKRGLTYGVYTYIAWLGATEYIGGSVASANGTVGEAIDVVAAEWKRMAEGGVTPEELDKAKKYMTGSYALRFDGNAKIARVMAGMQLDGFVPEYINTRNERLNAVTVEDIERVAKQHLQPDGLRFVVVGQPEGVVSTD